MGTLRNFLATKHLLEYQKDEMVKTSLASVLSLFNFDTQIEDFHARLYGKLKKGKRGKKEMKGDLIMHFFQRNDNWK